jgi:hypothetical protein
MLCKCFLVKFILFSYKATMAPSMLYSLLIKPIAEWLGYGLNDGGIVYFYPQQKDRYFGQHILLLSGYRRRFLRGEVGVYITTTIQCLG